MTPLRIDNASLLLLYRVKGALRPRRCWCKCPGCNTTHLVCARQLMSEFSSAQEEGELRVPLNAKGVPWDVDITARFFGYAMIGWSVTEPSPRLFHLLHW